MQRKRKLKWIILSVPPGQATRHAALMRLKQFTGFCTVVVYVVADMIMGAVAIHSTEN
jgi:hypothetical protein